MIRTVAAYCLETLLIFIAVYAALMTAFYHQGRIFGETAMTQRLMPCWAIWASGILAIIVIWLVVLG